MYPYKTMSAGTFERNIVLAMAEPHLSNILTGKKTVEIRRNRPKMPIRTGTKFFLYHKKAIYGWFKCSLTSDTVYRIDNPFMPDTLRDSILEPLCEPSCVSKAFIYNYLKGAKRPVLYYISAVKVFKQPLPVLCRPQSWIYSTKELEEQIDKAIKDGIV